MYRIQSIISAIRLALIRHINGIFTLFGNCRSPHYTALIITLSNTLRSTIRTFSKRILSLGIELASSCETALCTRIPRTIARIFIVNRLGSHIIIDNHFSLLHIALARQHHIRTSIFEHRHKIGNNIALRIEILYRLPQTRTLPAPPSTTIIEHIAVALPHCNVATRQTVRRLRLRRKARYQRARRTVCKSLLSLDCLFAQCSRYKILNMMTISHNRDLIVLELLGQNGTHAIIYRLDIILAKWIIRHIYRSINRQSFAIDSRTLHLDILNRHDFTTNNSVEDLRYFFALFRRNALSIYVKRRCRK